VLRARRSRPSGAAARRALAELAPPAAAAGLALLLAYLALGLLVVAMMLGLLVFALTVPFSVLDALITGHAPRPHLGPIHGIAFEAYALLLVALLLLLGAVTWMLLGVIRRRRVAHSASEDG
jgi:uncharacterized membrane protein